MTNPQIKEPAQQLEQLADQESAIVQIWQEGRNEDHYSISANRKGLLLFACERLKAASKFPEHIHDDADDNINFEKIDFFTDGDVLPY